MAASEAMSNSKGLDGALWKKIGSKFDREDAKATLLWMQAVSGEDMSIPADVGPEEFLDILQSGYFLCKFAQKVDSDIKMPKRIKKKGNAFVFRNQIEVFTKAMRVFGVKETDVFTSQDLYNKENPNNVVIGMMQLNAKLQTYKDFKGPFMQGGFKASTENKRVFSEEVIRKGKTVVPKWSEGSLATNTGPRLDGAGIVKTAGNEGWKDSGVVPKWSEGSLAHNSGPRLDGAGIVKTAGNEDWKDTGGVSKWSEGSIYMEPNKGVDKIIKNVANEDWKASGEVPKMFQPVQRKEKKSNFDATGIIKHA